MKHRTSEHNDVPVIPESEPVSRASTRAAAAAGRQRSSDKLSYKFQRLRERLRQAIEVGEFRGKLPGERQLARRFRVNAKTLSKALTDLAAEGLLERNIGRGTFVKGTVVPDMPSDRWLIICDADQSGATILSTLQRINPNSQVVTDTTNLRPSFLNQFKGAVNFAWSTPDEFLRSLVVRNINVVMVNREPTVFSMNSVLVDRALGASCLARDLILGGHRRFLAVEKRGQTAIIEAIRRSAQRYDPEVIADGADPNDVPAAVERGVTAVICGTLPLAQETRRALERAQVNVPAKCSLACVGSGLGDYPCTGYYIHADQKADAIVQLLRDPTVKRPTTLWLNGTYLDLGTTAALQSLIVEPESLHLPGPRLNQLTA
jgi:hypothetical protein